MYAAKADTEMKAKIRAPSIEVAPSRFSANLRSKFNMTKPSSAFSLAV